jgi:hypothetical protein
MASAWELRSEWLYIISLSGSASEQPLGLSGVVVGLVMSRRNRNSK